MIATANGADFCYRTFSNALPRRRESSVVAWCEKHLRLPGSARSEAFIADISPWGKAVLERARVPKSKTTFVKPVQAGGSVVGEAAIAYWISCENGGDIFYYWQNDTKAEERWKTRVERILKATKPVMARLSDRGADAVPELRRNGTWTSGYVQFPHMNFTMLGAKTARNVASESVRFEVNEEIHDIEAGWEDGRLEQAHARTTAFWNSVIINISNAGFKGSQLEVAMESATMRRWQVKCPGCGLYHTMRTRWEDDRPDLGGLRYELEGSRLESGDINYSRLIPTIRYQMPCGYVVRENPNDNTERRQLSLSGRYSEPNNPGAPPDEESYTLEAVSIDYIPWLDLIKQKHAARAALRNGDTKKWYDYLRERECIFPDPNDRPTLNRIVLSDAKKDREGLSNRLMRAGGLDRQEGQKSKGEMPHWWGVIQDAALIDIEYTQKIKEQYDIVGANIGDLVTGLKIRTVYEGKILTDSDAADVMMRHEVNPHCVVCDSGDDTNHVYQFCMEHGFDATKGEDVRSFAHKGGVRKTYSEERPLCLMMNMFPTKPIDDEAQYFLYSQQGLMEKLSWLRSSPLIVYETPSDVSQDFIDHMDSWQLENRRKVGTNQLQKVYVQRKTRDDMLFCAGYCALSFERAGLWELIGKVKPKK